MWSKYGPQGNSWFAEEIAIGQQGHGFLMMFEAYYGNEDGTVHLWLNMHRFKPYHSAQVPLESVLTTFNCETALCLLEVKDNVASGSSAVSTEIASIPTPCVTFLMIAGIWVMSQAVHHISECQVPCRQSKQWFCVYDLNSLILIAHLSFPIP